MRQIGPGLPGGEEPEEKAVRRVLRQAARHGSAAQGLSWIQGVLTLILAANPVFPAPFRAALGAMFVVAVVLWFRRRAAYRLGAPLRRATVDHLLRTSVVIRLDDGSVWGFDVTPDLVRSLHVGDRLTLPEPAEGDLVAARHGPGTAVLQPIWGRHARLYRPEPTTYLTPVPALTAPGPAPLSEGEARAFLAHEMADRGDRPLAGRHRRAVLEDIGREPTLERVTVEAVWAHRVRVRTGDGRLLGWPIKTGLTLLDPGTRPWATRVVDGLYVVLLVLADEGRRAEVIWPQGRAVAEEPEAPGGPDPTEDAAP